MADGFGDHHSAPEDDPQALRYELDSCRSHIEELRLELAEERDRSARLIDGLRSLTAAPASIGTRVRAQRLLREAGA